MRLNLEKIINMKIPLFDLDGTVFKAGEGSVAHNEGTNIGFLEIYGIEAYKNEVVTDGMTDKQIILEVLKKHGLTRKRVEEKFPEMINFVTNYFLKNSQPDDAICLPGVVNLLNRIHQLGGLNGILTGNQETVALKRLALAGINDLFDFGAFGDATDKRVELVGIAKNKLILKFGIDFPIRNFVIVGDSPKDIQCAKDANIPVIAVSTGRFTYDQLAEKKPDLLVSSLEELDKIVSFLGIN